MSVAGLLTEIAKEQYAGLTDAEIVAKLNEWQTAYVPCAAKLFNEALAVYSVHGRVEVLREKGTIGDELYIKWKQLLQSVELGGNVDSQATESLINELNAIDALGPDLPGLPPPLTRLLDMIRVQRNAARKVFNKDVDEIDLAAAKEREPLLLKIQARDAEILKLQQDRQAAYDELQKRDESGRIVGDKDFVAEWEK